jgi:hypothetical protein
LLVGRTGADLRVGLDLTIEEALYLRAAALDAAYMGRLDELAGIGRTLDQTTATLAGIVGAARGVATQQAVLETLRAQTASAIADARAHRPVSQSRQLSDLLVSFLAQRTSDLVTAATLGEVGKLDDAARDAAAHSDDVARPLAAELASLAGTDVSGPTEDAEVDLRLGLSRLLQEHVFLAGRAMSAASAQRDADLQAALAAADANAAEFGARMRDLYGEPLANRLTDGQRDHVRALAKLAQGGDRDQALSTLERVRTELDALLAIANPLLPRGIGISQQRLTDHELTSAADAFVARDWGSAYGHLHQAARQSQRLADLIARASVDRFPSRFTTTPAAPPRQSPVPAE